MAQQEQPRRKSPSDVTDEPWAIVALLIPPTKQRSRGGRPRKVHMREVLPTLCSLNRRGCPGERVPHALLPKRTVSDAFGPWRDDGTGAKMVKGVRERLRVAAGRAPPPSAVCLASQAGKTTAMGGPERGEDGGTKSNGRPRPLWVDTLGVWLAVRMPRAALAAGGAAPRLRGRVHPSPWPRLVTILAAQTDHHHALDAWMAESRPGGPRAGNARPAGPHGCTPLAKRWVMERTNAWQSRLRSNRQDEESRVASRTAMLQMSHGHRRRNRRAPCGRPVCHSRKDAA